MKLSDHAEHIRQLIDKAYRNKFGRLGIALNGNGINLLNTNTPEYDKLVGILNVFLEETGNDTDAYEKLVEEFTFTLFNRLAALKVMEAHTLHPEILTRRSQHGDRSFAHYLWLEQNPTGRNEELEGLIRFMESQFTTLGADIPLFSLDYPYHLLPTAIELNGIINSFNQVETDPQVEPDIWKSDDVLGWLYESYNNKKKADHKESGAKTEYNKVSIQSQVYTPRWVVKFLVDNSLGKLYLEMYPDSDIKHRYKIANAPNQQCRERKPLTEIKMIDPANGSGNFLLYGFDLYYDLYLDQIENYGAEYREKDIPELIIRHNLHGIDLDDRAVQLTQLGLYIKAKHKRSSIKIDHFNIVSSDFFLPEYSLVKHLFENGESLQPELERIVIDLWSDLQQAHKFGSLIRLDEKFEARLNEAGGKYTDAFTLFAEETQAEYGNFRSNFLTNLVTAVAHNAEQQGMTFLNTKTQDAITFLSLLTQKYSVAVANPPYTDSGDFGQELKVFIERNYKHPGKFNANLYVAFIRRCSELINESGKIAMIHPLTFMYIKSFEDVRKHLVEDYHINIFVDYGLSNLFGLIMAAPSFYVIEKGIRSNTKSLFISLDQYTRTPQEKYKKEFCLKALTDYINNSLNAHNFSIDQSVLKAIEGYPFIYWITNSLRNLFNKNSIAKYFNIAAGLQTGNNDRFVRYWWETDLNKIYSEHNKNTTWVFYAKGGPKNNWFGNNWTIVQWENEGFQIKHFFDNKGKLKSRPQNERFYFKEGITYSFLGGKKVSFRLLKNSIFDVSGSSLFPKNNKVDIHFALAFLNSNLSLYVLSCLNPTVNTQIGDLERLPFIEPMEEEKEVATKLVKENIAIKTTLNSDYLVESNFDSSPLLKYSGNTLNDRILNLLNNQNFLTVTLLINEAILNGIIYSIYNLNNDDIYQIESKVGRPAAILPVWEQARHAFISALEYVPESKIEFVKNLESTTFVEQQAHKLKNEFIALFQSNNDLEEFCLRNKVNPINIWYLFKISKILPESCATKFTLEFLADALRIILINDEDGIVPLTGLPGEPKLIDRLEQYCLSKGFTSAQFMQLDGLLGRQLCEYIEHYFFNDFSNHLNLFMYLPKTPFIWHLSSGEHQGFEVYVIIYKWNRDSLFKLKTQYLSKRIENLEYRLIELQDSISAQAQEEKEKIRLQIQEINEFTAKVDELIREGYDPKLDDGVGKNIAPLQKKGMLRAEVLNKKQLEKYLNADW